jgi:hypothetical protein
MKAGTRVRLTGKMVNHDSHWMPEEDIPVGTEGTVMWTTNDPNFKQIGVNWDNGRGLCLLPHDKYEIIKTEIELH